MRNVKIHTSVRSNLKNSFFYFQGYKWHFNETVLTVWSAPNYCYRCGNVAAILELDEHLQRDFTIFEAAPQESRGIPCKKPQADYFL